MTCRQAINGATRLIHSSRKPSIMEKAFALAQAYADRDGKPWWVLRRVVSRSPVEYGKIELLNRHPGQLEFPPETMRVFYPFLQR